MCPSENYYLCAGMIPQIARRVEYIMVNCRIDAVHNNIHQPCQRVENKR